MFRGERRLRELAASCLEWRVEWVAINHPLSGWESRSKAELELSEEHAKQESQPVDGVRSSGESSGRAGTWNSSAFTAHGMPRAHTVRTSKIDNASSGSVHVQSGGQRKQGPKMVPNKQRQ